MTAEGIVQEIAGIGPAGDLLEKARGSTSDGKSCRIRHTAGNGGTGAATLQEQTPIGTRVRVDEVMRGVTDQAVMVEATNQAVDLKLIVHGDRDTQIARRGQGNEKRGDTRMTRALICVEVL
ncbi:MAG: hypothetical protein LBV30_09260 [Propionibacteriaceae bacterium]|nr:hypothetical protein [Propionibacteriaceae bacterium]